MGILKHIKDRRLFPSTDSEPVRPPVLERLEPRIMLSGDGLLSIAPPDPFQDALLNTMPQVVQYAELLETCEQVEQQPVTDQKIDQQVGPSYPGGTDLWQPILTLSVDGSTVADDGKVKDADVDSVDGSSGTSVDVILDEIDPAQTSDDPFMLSVDSDSSTDNEAATTEIASITVAGRPRIPLPPKLRTAVCRYIQTMLIQASSSLHPSKSGDLRPVT